MGLFAVPDDLQLHASDRWFPSSFGHLLDVLAQNGAIQPKMLRLLMTQKWPKFRTADWRWVYVARCAYPAVVKIGISSDPVSRMVSLNTSVPARIRVVGAEYRFEIVGVLPYCGEEHESFLCEMFQDSSGAGREWFRDTAATRILCWQWARMRSDQGPKWERYRLESIVAHMLVGLQYVCVGKIPRYGYGLNSVRCSICRSWRHTRLACPQRKAA